MFKVNENIFLLWQFLKDLSFNNILLDRHLDEAIKDKFDFSAYSLQIPKKYTELSGLDHLTALICTTFTDYKKYKGNNNTKYVRKLSFALV